MKELELQGLNHVKSNPADCYYSQTDTFLQFACNRHLFKLISLLKLRLLLNSCL
jgi:hypothetical protein